jgi:hypothetical protein
MSSQYVVDVSSGESSTEDWTPPDVDLGPFIPYLNNGGLARFTGVAPVVMLENIRVAGVTRISKGRYRVTHQTPYATDQYSATPSVFDASPRLARITARAAGYVEVRVVDLAGVSQDPTEITVKTERVVTQ